MDFVDENEDNPLFFKNVELRAQIREINEATRRALPSLKDLNSEEESAVCLSREEMIAQFYANRPQLNPSVMPVNGLQATLVNPADEFILSPKEMNGKLKTSNESKPVQTLNDEEKSDIATDCLGLDPDNFDSDLRPWISTKSEGTNPRCATAAASIQFVDCTSAQGDGFQCDEPEIPSVAVDVRPKRGTSSSVKSSNYNDNLKIESQSSIMKSDTSGGQERKICLDEHLNLDEISNKLESKDQEQVSKAELKNVGKIENRCIPRACFDDDTCQADGPHSETMSKCEDFNPHFLREIFEIFPGHSQPYGKEVENILVQVSSLSSCTFSRPEMRSITRNSLSDSESNELNSRLHNVWDWVTAIPRAYFLEEGNLLDCFKELTLPLDGILDERLVQETFKLPSPSSDIIKESYREATSAVPPFSVALTSEKIISLPENPLQMQNALKTCASLGPLQPIEINVSNRLKENETGPDWSNPILDGKSPDSTKRCLILDAIKEPKLIDTK